MDESQIVSAMRRADQVYYAQLCDVETLEFGLAYLGPSFPDSDETNQFREVVLGTTPPAAAYESVERLFGQRGLTCRRWVPALGQSTDVFEAFLPRAGWSRCDVIAMVLQEMHAPVPEGSPVRVLPGRAMRKALRATFGEGAAGEIESDACTERMNDSNLDVFVAMLEDRPAGRVAYHEVGDIAALRDLYVLPEQRGRGVGRALARHAVSVARRLSPRVFLAPLDAARTDVRALLERAGFRAAGALAEYRRGVT